MDRSHGGLTTEIHALVDALGHPILLKLTEGQAHDGRLAADMYDSVGAGQTLLAPSWFETKPLPVAWQGMRTREGGNTDRAYDSDGLRDMLTERGAAAKIRLMPTCRRFPAFDAELSKQRNHVERQRNHVERFFSKLKHFRAIATRYAKRDDNFLASVQRASIRIWLRTYESVTYGESRVERRGFQRTLTTRAPSLSSQRADRMPV